MFCFLIIILTQLISTSFFNRFTEIKGGRTTDSDLLFSADKNPSAFKDWINTIPENPDINSYSLNSLHELMPAEVTTRQNLRSAISHYILEKGLLRNCSGHCQTGIRSDSRDSCICQCHNNPAVNLDCCPTRKGMARVIVTVEKASGLWGDYYNFTDGYVKVFFNKMEYRSPVIDNNNDPHWNMVLDLGQQDLSSVNTVKFEVWDQDSGWDDDWLGTCNQVLTAGVKSDLCNLNNGQLFYKWNVTCAPSLSGNSCSDYKPSPMDQSLRKFYVSRHAHPIPKAMLREMGVFVNESSPWQNKSLTANKDRMQKVFQLF